MRKFDVIIAGGGAAGLMAAGVAASKGFRVLLCEKMEKPARKVRITGKGRCNLTNMRSEEEFLGKVRGEAGEFFRTAFHAFSNEDTVRFFERIGVPLTVERGERVFPASGRAWDVADAHVRWCREQGAVIECHTRVDEIIVRGGKVRGAALESFRPESTARLDVQDVRNTRGAQGTRDGNRGSENQPAGQMAHSGGQSAQPAGRREEVEAPNVIIATGGLSYPATGSTGDGYSLAYELGHRIEEVRPSLVPLESEAAAGQRLEGLLLKNIAARLTVDGNAAAEEFGDMEFTHFGMSGPVILKLSRAAVDALIEERRVELTIDLKPALSVGILTERIEREVAALGPQAPLREVLRKLLPGKLIAPAADKISKELGINLKKITVGRLTRGEKQAIARALKNFNLPVTGYRPFEEAIVTAGGVCTAEVDPRTMQSELVGGLYFAGEVLDIDADTGGYNLQIAYSTGHLAGQLLK